MTDILVIGDYIKDVYRFFKATRLCPEAPVPVLVHDRDEEHDGGSSLVTAQLKALEVDCIGHYGSRSVKERIYADNHLVCRIDSDSIEVEEAFPFERQIIKLLKIEKPKILIISDYGKWAITEAMAGRIMRAAKILEIPVLVDAKNHWSWYPGAFCYFPNEREAGTWKLKKGSHVIHKLGEKGCTVDGDPIHQFEKRTVRDTSGAGDIFLAAFAYGLLSALPNLNKNNNLPYLKDCAHRANHIAGLSVERVGTFVVDPYKSVNCRDNNKEK